MKEFVLSYELVHLMSSECQNSQGKVLYTDKIPSPQQHFLRNYQVFCWSASSLNIQTPSNKWWFNWHSPGQILIWSWRFLPHAFACDCLLPVCRLLMDTSTLTAGDGPRRLKPARQGAAVLLLRPFVTSIAGSLTSPWDPARCSARRGTEAALGVIGPRCSSPLLQDLEQTTVTRCSQSKPQDWLSSHTEPTNKRHKKH